ncbi:MULTISPECIES: hypothetical protein [unclassified Clostridium]|uniref:hypothetical protein n=1 Tax=unclassified Clostridium TaxID=2614128 RepID=UPI001C8CCBC4|nr:MULTISPECIES: hypothetical protein [unclassified Clostridium]MBX9136417.1 hypothetical protein [Clostridium sp. K12(2020)]MBX9143312.1 hypothetical protein [Clostridium sp. K13]
MYKSRKDKNKRKYKESIKIVLAIVIVVGAGIMYAGFNNLNKNISKEDNITVENEESFQESNEVKNSSVSQELSIVRVAAIPEGIQALTNTFESVKALNENVEVDIVSNEYNNELILSLINGEHDIIVTSRQMNEEEKLLVEQNNIKYEELLFSYLNSYENTLLYTYVNIDDYNNNLACRLFLKNYYNLSGDNLDLEVLSPLYENIYEEVSNYLLLLESYPRE